MYVVRARASISTNTSYDVVDLNERYLRDEENVAGAGWGSGTSFKCLPKSRLTTECHLPDAKLLREQRELQLARYLKDPDDSNLRGMFLDPVMLTADHMFLLKFFGETHCSHWEHGSALPIADIKVDIVLHQHIGNLNTSNDRNKDSVDS